MPDLSLSQLADFARQGQNMSDSFYAPILGGQRAVAGYYQNKYLPQNIQAELSLKQAQSQLAGAQAGKETATANQINNLTPAKFAELNAKAYSELGVGNKSNADANLTKAVTPARVAQANAEIYSDPHIRLAHQAKLMADALRNGPQNQGANIPLQSGGLPNPQDIQNNLPSGPPPRAQNNFTGSMQDIANTISGIQPVVSAANKLDASTTQANQTATNNANLQTNTQKEAADAQQNFRNQEYWLDMFDQNYDKSNLKGPAIGDNQISSSIALTPGDKSAEQMTDIAANNLRNSIAKSIANSGHITNLDNQLAEASKGLTRKLEPNAKKNLVNFYRAKVGQDRQEQQFLNNFFQNNPDGTVQEALTLWNEGRDQRPYFDKNKNEATSYATDLSDFSSPEALQALRNPSQGYYVKLPKIKDKKEFKNWYDNLSPNIQQEVLKKIGGGNG